MEKQRLTTVATRACTLLHYLPASCWGVSLSVATIPSHLRQGMNISHHFSRAHYFYKHLRHSPVEEKSSLLRMALEGKNNSMTEKHQEPDFSLM